MFSIYLLQSIAALYPDQIRVEDHLTDTVLQRLGILDQSCITTGRSAVRTSEEFVSTCAPYSESRATYKVYPNMGHSQVLFAGRYDVVKWLSDRFQGVSVEERCITEEVQPLTELYSQGEHFWLANLIPFN